MSVFRFLQLAKPFAEYADLSFNNIKSLYLSVNDVLEEPDDIDSTPKITLILEVNQSKENSMLMECASSNCSKWLPIAYVS